MAGDRLRHGESQKVEVFEEAGEFAALEAEWNELYLECPTATPFQSWGWLYSWWEHYGEGHGLRLITVRNPDGLLTGILPLMLERRPGLGRLLMVGAGSTDYLDVLIRAGSEEEVCEAGARGMEALGRWSVADLEQLRPEAAAWGLLDRWRGPGGHVPQDRCPIIEVKPLEELLKAFSGNRRRVVRRSIRRAEADGLRRRVAGTEDAARAARRLVALHRESWEGRGIGQEHLTRRFESLIVDAAHRMTASGAGAVSEFWRDGEVVVSSLLLFGSDHVGIHTSGATHEALKRYQCSSLYVWDAVEAARLENKGHVDLLRGEEPYKLVWSHRVIPTRRLILGKSRCFWLPYAAYHVLRSRAKRYANSQDAPRWATEVADAYRAARRKLSGRAGKT